jgi:hypothetical protein
VLGPESKQKEVKETGRTAASRRSCRRERLSAEVSSTKTPEAAAQAKNLHFPAAHSRRSRTTPNLVETPELLVDAQRFGVSCYGNRVLRVELNRGSWSSREKGFERFPISCRRTDEEFESLPVSRSAREARTFADAHAVYQVLIDS